MSNSWSTVRFLTFAENEALLNFIVDTAVRAVLPLISIPAFSVSTFSRPFMNFFVFPSLSFPSFHFSFPLVSSLFLFYYNFQKYINDPVIIDYCIVSNIHRIIQHCAYLCLAVTRRAYWRHAVCEGECNHQNSHYPRKCERWLRGKRVSVQSIESSLQDPGSRI